MTHEEFISLIRNPHQLSAEHASGLKELVERYPYFVSPRMMLSKVLTVSDDLEATSYTNLTSMYCADRKSFHDFIYPEIKAPEDQPKQLRTSKNSGDYFDMIHVIESQGGDTRQSLKNLAEKLREARSMVSKEPVVKAQNRQPEPVKTEVRAEITDYFALPVERLKTESPEITVKKLIAEHKYSDALEILRSLNLNNPKKSVYFADQIRFLEKVILNSKK